MAKKGGLLKVLFGMATGAAATFLADEKNREKTVKVAKKAIDIAQKAQKEYADDPERFKAKIKTQTEKVAKKVAKKAKKVTTKKAKRVTKKTKRVAKKAKKAA